MASRTLLQLFTLSIIFTNQIEARTFSKTRDLEKSREYDIITTSVNKRSKAIENGRSDTTLKKIYNHIDQRSDTNAESRHISSRHKYNRKYKHEDNEEAESEKPQAKQQREDNLKSHTTIISHRIKLTSLDNRKHFTKEDRCSEDACHSNNRKEVVAEAMAQTIAMKKRKQKGATKLEPNEESSSQNYMENKNHPTVKPARRQKYLTVTHRNTKIRTTEVNREKQLFTKITHKQDSEFENEICKTKHCDFKNHRSFEKISREHDDKLKRRDEFKTASKDNNKKKVNKDNMKAKHRFLKSHRTFKRLPLENDEYEIKHRDIKKSVLVNTISVENDIFVQKQVDAFTTVEEPVSSVSEEKHITKEETVSKQVKPEYKPKISHNFQKKRQRDKMVRKVSHTTKVKHHSEKVLSNQEKHKPARNEIIRNGKKRNTNLGDAVKVDDADAQTLESQEEKEALRESYQSEDNVLNKPRLPFYFSTTTKRDRKNIFKKQSKILVLQKDEMETDTPLDDLNIKHQYEEETLENDSSEELSKENNFLNKPRLPFYVTSTTQRVVRGIFKKQPKKLVSQKHKMEADNFDLNVQNQDKKETLQPCEELTKENNVLNKARLPCYVSLTTKRVINDIFKKETKKLVSQKDEMATDILLGDLNTVLKGRSDLTNQNIDLNTTINRLSSSKILDFITDRVASRMLKKLEKRLVASTNSMRRTEVNPEKVEQIDIMLEKDGDMVMIGGEHIKESEEDEYDRRDGFYPY